MSDIKDARLLWIKGGLFLMLGCLASLLLLAISPNLATVVLLAIAIWAFCRAYYFAFYVVEKYADPSFRYAGLTSFLRYCIQGPELYRLSQNCHDRQSPAVLLGDQRMGAVHWLAIKWLAFALVLNLLVPSIYHYGMRESFIDELVMDIWVGWCVTATAICVIGAALLNAPLKLRAPVCFAALFSMTVALIAGARIVSGDDELWVLFAYAALAFTVGFAILSFYRLRTSYQLDVDHSIAGADSNIYGVGNEQLSLRYMFITTTAIAVALVVIKLFVPASFGNGLPPLGFFLYIGMIVFGICTLLAMVTISALHFSLSTDSNQRRVHTVLLAVCLLILPFLIMYAISQIPQPTEMASNRSPSYREYASMYVFLWSYVFLLLLALYSFSTVGLRLVKRANGGVDH